MSICSNCNTLISVGSGLGRCIRCSKLAKFSGLQCPCGVPIGRSNRSGLCTKCYREDYRKREKSDYVKGYKDVGSLIVKPKTGKWTTCHMPGCDEYFELREGQHPKMAWCDKCRKTPNYKNYLTYSTMTRTVKL